VEKSGKILPQPVVVGGNVSLIANCHDMTPIPVPGAWHDLPVTPTVVRWSLVNTEGMTIIPWSVSANFSGTLLPATDYDYVYAPGTTENKIYPNSRHPGLYRFLLSKSFDTTKLSNGEYIIVVEVNDIRNNVASAKQKVVFSN